MPRPGLADVFELTPLASFESGIAAKIGSDRAVDDGAWLVNEAGRTMGDIVDAIKRVTATIAQIATASGEQSAGIGQLNTAIAEMDQATQRNAALVAQAATAAESMRDQARELVHMVSTFKLEGVSAA